MTKKLKSKEQVQSDIDLLGDSLTSMKEAIRIFYGEYYDWEHNYSRIGIKYYEALEDAYERLDFASKRSEKEVRRQRRIRLIGEQQPTKHTTRKNN